MSARRGPSGLYLLIPFKAVLSLDESWRAAWLPLVERFYALFDSVFVYWADLTQFLVDLDKGVFTQQSAETLLWPAATNRRGDVDGETTTPNGYQLLAEALYLYGVMLLTVESKIPGQVRERLLVLYHRWVV